VPKGLVYHHSVTSDAEEASGKFRTLYSGTDHADAMAAWSKAIGEGHEYVVLESLIERPQPGQEG
jgi:hypothetical protein